MNKTDPYQYTPLPEPIPITEQNWPDDVLPLVHTKTMTYMHENYIRDCIEGILMQRTTFPVRVLIHDDASTDNTANIVREYEKQYPKLIRAYCQPENTCRHPNRRQLRAEFKSWRIGKYVAICEGDDYWTDPLKLQKQVDFLEAHPEYVISLHNSWVVYHDSNKAPIPAIPNPKLELSLRDFIDIDYFRRKGGIISRGHTSSIVFRNGLIAQRPQSLSKSVSGDLVLLMQLAEHGKARFIDEYMSCYRKHSGGITIADERHQPPHIYLNRLKMLDGINRYFNKRFNALIRKQKAMFHFALFKYYFKKRNFLLSLRWFMPLLFNPAKMKEVVSYASRHLHAGKR